MGGGCEEKDETAIRQDILCPGATYPQNSSPVDCSNMFILHHQCTEILSWVGISGEMIVIDSFREFLKKRQNSLPALFASECKTLHLWHMKVEKDSSCAFTPFQSSCCRYMRPVSMCLASVSVVCSVYSLLRRRLSTSLATPSIIITS